MPTGPFKMVGLLAVNKALGSSVGGEAEAGFVVSASYRESDLNL